MLKPSGGAETGELSDKTGRGKNTTRHVETFELDGGGVVYDTPGFTSFEIPGKEEADLQFMFPEMRPLIGQCRFDDCRHLKEPGCVVTEAVENGQIKRSRYESYVSQLEDIRKNNSY
jgi:ribosome biogenesis GTPase